MRAGVKVAVLIAAACVESLFAMNGIAVSAAKSKDVMLGDYEGSDWPHYGHIQKFTIANNSVTKRETIYDEYVAGYPVMNLYGNRVAFIRKDLRKAETSRSLDNHNYIAVMDIDGRNAHDIDTFTNSFHPRTLIDWPAGDWVYYVSQTEWGYTAGHLTSQVYRCKYNDPSTQQLVVQYGGTPTFAMSLDATRAGITSFACNGPGYAFGNVPHAFPPTSEPDCHRWTARLMQGCGSYISPSGQYHHHFWGGGHDELRVEKWNPPYEMVSEMANIRWTTMGGWTGMPLDSVSVGSMNWSRWAVNSDKWLCMSGANKIGATNQVLVNWIDNAAINTSRNSLMPDGYAGKNDPGDLWVAGGPGGSTYEDVSGAWVSVPGFPVNVQRRPMRTDFSKAASSQKVNAYSTLGKLLVTGDRVKISGTLPAGTYVMAPVSGGKAAIVKLTITGNEVLR